MWFKQAFFRLIDWAAIDRRLKRPLNDFRAALGLPAVDRVLHQWVHSPQCVIGFFPEWFAERQPDWPPRTHLVGFPLWDGGGETSAGAMSLSPEAEEFLDAGAPLLVFTPGSAAATMQRFFAESVEAARRLDVRAMLITNFQEQLPRDLPRNVRAFGYLPFSEVLPRAALLVYHGGIGTLAQTIERGIPHLAVPNGHDQFDNAWRIERLGWASAFRRLVIDPTAPRMPCVRSSRIRGWSGAAGSTPRRSIRPRQSRGRANSSKVWRSTSPGGPQKGRRFSR